MTVAERASRGSLNPVAVAARGKGASTLARRARVIRGRYGITPTRMEQRVAAVAALAERFGARPTLPITAAALRRNPSAVARHAAAGVEFAVHGLYHVDHAALDENTQATQLRRAAEVFEASGMPPTGFRAPYLRWDSATLAALRGNGYLYDSSQAMDWPVPQDIRTDSYARVLGFASSLPAARYPVTPWIEDGIVRIPCCLPDDEAAIDRLALSSDVIASLWLDILERTIERDDLFTLAVHPERIDLCRDAVEAVLEAARRSRPPVWIARLDDIARWWLDRAAAVVDVRETSDGTFDIRVSGPPGLTLEARGVDADPDGGRPSEASHDRFVPINGSRASIRSAVRPFIGVDPSAPPSVANFLHEDGYIVEAAPPAEGRHSFIVDRREFGFEDRQPLLDELRQGQFPLVRVARWPNGARAALSLTGDVDALTIWDYAFRLVGR